MELEGHPTQDIIEELQRRGARQFQGTPLGPHDVDQIAGEFTEGPALWLMIPREAFQTGVDEESFPE